MEITDRVQDIHMDNIKSEYMPELARHAAEVREKVIISKFTDASVNWVNNYASDAALVDGFIASAANGILTMKELRKAALFQKVNKRGGHDKYGGKPVAILHPNVMADLLDDTDLKDRLLTPGNENGPIKSGTLQNYQFYGMFVQETLIAESRSIAGTGDNSGTTKTVYTSYVLGRDPYVVVKLGDGSVEWKMTGFEAEKTDPLGQKATFGYKMWVGAKVIDPIAIIKVYSCSNYDVSGLATFSFDHDNNGGTSAITTDVWAAPATQS
jgi:N4-gp56 family major capsid protein